MAGSGVVAKVLSDDLVELVGHFFRIVLLPHLEHVLHVPVPDLELLLVQAHCAVPQHYLELVLGRLPVRIPVSHEQRLLPHAHFQDPRLEVPEEHLLLHSQLKQQL